MPGGGVRFPALPDFLINSVSGAVCTIEELLGRKSSDSGLESREYGRRDPSRLPRGSLYPQNLILTSPISGGRSVGIVLSRTQATEFYGVSNSVTFFGMIHLEYFSEGCLGRSVLWAQNMMADHKAE
jgi:hypothetical protein